MIRGWVESIVRRVLQAEDRKLRARLVRIEADIAELERKMLAQMTAKMVKEPEPVEKPAARSTVAPIRFDPSLPPAEFAGQAWANDVDWSRVQR